METVFKTELHAHTKPVSGCSDIETKEMVNIYKENGYDSLVITNHFPVVMPGETVEEKVKWYLNDYYQCYREGQRVGLDVILGAELRFTENSNDYLVFGISPEELTTIYALLPYGIDRFYREFKNEKNVIIQAHPFRDGMERVNPASIDGMEIINLHPYFNARIGVATKYAQENNMIVTCGSDFHHHGHECMCGILTNKPMRNSFDIAEVLKSGSYKMSIGNLVVSW